MSYYDDLVRDGLLVMWDLTRGGLRDLYGTGIALNASISGSPKWVRSAQGLGTYHPVGDNYFLVGNPAALNNLSNVSVFAQCNRIGSHAAPFAGMIAKPLAYGLYWNSGAEPKALVTYDFGGGATRVSTWTSRNDGVVRVVGATFRSGATNASEFFVNGTSAGTFTLTVSSWAGSWLVGSAGDPGGDLEGIINRVCIIKQAITAQQASEFSDILASRRGVGDPPKRVMHSYPSMGATAYAAKGIFLDADLGREVAAGVVRVPDRTNNWPGTLVGAPIPLPEGGTWFDGVDDQTTHGDVTQMDGAAALSVACLVKLDAITDNAGLWGKSDLGNNRTAVRQNGAANPTRLDLFAMASGLSQYRTSTATQLRAGFEQHVIYIFDGSLAGDAKLSAMVDGEVIALNASPNPLPANLHSNATPLRLMNEGNLAGRFSRGTMREYRSANVAWTVAQGRAEYLQFAKRIDWQCSGEGTPVSLVASVGAGAYLGDWRVISGTFKVSEDSTGKRWVECVTAGTIVTPQSNATGTWVFTCSKAAGAARVAFAFVASQPLAFNTAPQNSYVFRVEPTLEVMISRSDNGVSAAVNLMSAVGYVAAGVPYTYAVARRVSDGRFTLWIRGGAFTTWTLVSTVGGSGTNPSAGDATWMASAWATVAMGIGDKLLIFDPAKPGQFPTHFAGALDPVAGEVPIP